MLVANKIKFDKKVCVIKLHICVSIARIVQWQKTIGKVLKKFSLDPPILGLFSYQPNIPNNKKYVTFVKQFY